MTSEPIETEPADAPRRSRHAARPVRFTLGAQEFVKSGLSRFDPRDPYYFAVSLSWSRFVLLFLGAELVINTLFAGLYMLGPGAIANQTTPRFLGAFFFSLETLATVGYGEMYPATLFGHIVAAAEILTGVIFTAIMTGLLFVRFSKPRAKIVYATHPVVTTHNGRPTLMLRIGNARHNLLHDAEVCLYTLARTVSEEGQRAANIVQLPLVRTRFPVFAILWTVMHVIDEASPLWGVVPGDEALDKARIFLTVRARDPALGQTVSDLHVIRGTDIRFGMRYVDAVEATSDSQVVADYALLSVIEPDTPRSDAPAATFHSLGPS